MACDVVVGCIGFERSNTLCEWLTGRKEVKTTNYLDQHMMYLADAEIDEGRCFRIQMYSVVRCLFFFKDVDHSSAFFKGFEWSTSVASMFGIEISCGVEDHDT